MGRYKQDMEKTIKFEGWTLLTKTEIGDIFQRRDKYHLEVSSLERAYNQALDEKWRRENLNKR